MPTVRGRRRLFRYTLYIHAIGEKKQQKVRGDALVGAGAKQLGKHVGWLMAFDDSIAGFCVHDFVIVLVINSLLVRMAGGQINYIDDPSSSGMAGMRGWCKPSHRETNISTSRFVGMLAFSGCLPAPSSDDEKYTKALTARDAR